MTILIYLSNRHKVVAIMLGIYLLTITTSDMFSTVNTLLIIFFSMIFPKHPLVAIPSYSIAIDTIACCVYQLDWVATIMSGLLWNAKWIILSGVIEIAYRTYRCGRAQFPELALDETICVA